MSGHSSPRKPSRLARIMGLLIVAGVVAVSGGPAGATGPTITGAGSTWVQIALDQWRADAARFGLSVNYQGVGSTAGRTFFIIGQTDFAASEIPFEPAELAQLRQKHSSFQYVPDVAGATSLMYNLKDSRGQQITNLQLSATTAAEIFTRKITNWDDPAISKDNGGRKFPSQTIIPVLRSDGAGTGAKLGDYFMNQAPQVMKPFLAQTHASLPLEFWPQFPGSVAQKGSDGVANYVANSATGPGSIGYVETGYAIQRRFPVAAIKNKSGHYVTPTWQNIAETLTHATLNKDLTQNLTGVYNAPEADAYPLSSYSYLITHTTGFNPAKGAVLGAWMIYIACAGQQKAAALGYSPLPVNLVQYVFAAVKRIPGAPNPPSKITKKTCPNPLVGTGVQGASGPGSSNSGGNNTAQTQQALQKIDPSATTPGTTTSGGTTTSTSSLPPGVPTSAALAVTPLSLAEQQKRFEQAVATVSAAQETPSLVNWFGPLWLFLLLIVPLALSRVKKVANRAPAAGSESPAGRARSGGGRGRSAGSAPSATAAPPTEPVPTVNGPGGGPQLPAPPGGEPGAAP